MRMRPTRRLSQQDQTNMFARKQDWFLSLGSPISSGAAD
jgi:hypothetical protein